MGLRVVLDVAERLGLATALGLVVGLERYRAGKEAGIRTFALVAMAGCLAQFAGQPLYGALVLVLTGVLVATANSYALRRGNSPELTTSAALMVTAIEGILAGQGQVFAAVSSAIVVLMLLAWKDEMADFSHHLSREEVHAAIMLLLLGLVVLPLLPAGPVDPWGLVDLRRTWVMVVLISAIGFGNYLLLRRYGARGIVYTGFLGGLVNSTATVAELTRTMGAEDASSTDDVFTGIMLAKVAMYLRNGVLLAVFAPGALRVGLLPIGLMIAPSVGLAARGLRRLSIGTPDVRLRSPFSLRSALEFGVYFLVLTVAAGTAQRGMGTPGFYAVAVLGGAVSSAGATAAAASLARQGVIPLEVAGLGAVLASLGSALALVPPIARATREKGLLRRVAIAVAGVTGMGLLGLGLNRSILG